MTRITVFGLGRVGLTTSVAFASLGHEVVGYDINPEKVAMIAEGKQPFHEVQLPELLKKVIKSGKFTVTDKIGRSIQSSNFYVICVGTPSAPDGSMDTTQLIRASRLIGGAFKGRRDFPIVVVKSTVLPGTTDGMLAPTIKKTSGLNSASFGLCMNPEFLREGTGIEDTLKPDRIIVGSNVTKTGDLLEEFYRDFDCVKWRCNIITAEMVKYATNAFLATKVSFANEIANMCDVFSIDSDKVLEGVGLDSRINPRFFVPGVGFGGSCLPKDVRAAISESKKRGYDPRLLQSVLEFNERQALRVVDILEEEVGKIEGKRVAVLGIAFKSGTDDVRESRALPIVRELQRRGATVAVHDPIAKPEGMVFGADVEVAPTAKQALKGSSGCIIQASWDEYKKLGKTEFLTMKKAVVIDGRRTLKWDDFPKEIIYRRIG